MCCNFTNFLLFVFCQIVSHRKRRRQKIVHNHQHLQHQQPTIVHITIRVTIPLTMEIINSMHMATTAIIIIIIVTTVSGVMDGNNVVKQI